MGTGACFNLIRVELRTFSRADSRQRAIFRRLAGPVLPFAAALFINRPKSHDRSSLVTDSVSRNSGH